MFTCCAVALNQLILGCRSQEASSIDSPFIEDSNRTKWSLIAPASFREGCMKVDGNVRRHSERREYFLLFIF